MEPEVDCSFERGVAPLLDRAVDAVVEDLNIAGRTARVGLNWYKDGNSAAGAHRHDCWTALLSFGHERILTVDGSPVPCCSRCAAFFVFAFWPLLVKRRG